jgi:hypothetical protein
MALRFFNKQPVALRNNALVFLTSSKEFGRVPSLEPKVKPIIFIREQFG